MPPRVIDIRVDPTSYTAATEQIIHWAQDSEARYVCVANVHMAMEAHDSAEFRTIVNAADLVTPDGMPLVWMLRAQGFKNQTRVYGPELTLQVLAAAAAHNLSVGFYGGTPETLATLQRVLHSRFPRLQVEYQYSPPFRSLSNAEDEAIINAINAAGIKILFVGLGCPKQERWMAAHRTRIPAVMLGVGAAFDFIAGVKNPAPPWLQRLGLEWLFRFSQEPGRLWRRYVIHNPRFVVLACADLLRFYKDSCRSHV